MTIDVSLLISIVSVSFAVYSVINNSKRNRRKDEQSENTQLTTVIVELKYIGNGIEEIKREIKNIKNELQELRDRMTINEQAIKSCHKRLDAFEQKLERTDSN